MTQQYTIHKFLKTKYDGAPYSAIQVEETEWVSPFPHLLIDRCIELAKNAAGEKYLLEYRCFGGQFKIDQGQFPGAELYEPRAKEYAMAWLVVPVIENLN